MSNLDVRSPSKPLSSTESSVSESRKRQTKRDEAIRRKLENDLKKRSAPAARKSRTRTGQPGSVLSLHPSEAVTCRPNNTVYEAAQLMSAKRENCILVVDENSALLGIFTAKDLAFRVVGAGLKAANVTIDSIMTSNPLCATSNTLASEALNLMVEKGFRHLPVIDEDTHEIIGVLDITRCYQEAMEKLERMYESSKKLHDALHSVNSEIGFSGQPYEVVRYFENLQSVMSGPDLESVLDEGTVPSYVNVKTTVFDAAVIMKEHHTTAVLVRNDTETITGIFTSKDVVLRVIAAGLDPKTVSVVRVMTPQPDVAPKTLSIQAALRKMFEGHYLNLPVTEDGEVVGVVEVLKLTHSTLTQIQSISESDSQGQGPAWNQFWNGLDNESNLSESLVDGVPDISQSELNQFTLDASVAPNDSASVAGRESRFSALQSEPFAFKFKKNKKVYRVTVNPEEGYEHLVALVSQKTGETEFEMTYLDDEQDLVTITNDHDLLHCVSIYRQQNLDKADLFLHHPSEEVDLESIKKHAVSRGDEWVAGVPNTYVQGAAGAVACAAILGFLLARR